MELKPGYKQTLAGVIPEDWDSKPLAELGYWKGGATPSMQNSNYWSSGTVPWVSSGDVKSVLISDTPMKITESAVKETSTTLLPSNSIMIVTRSGILRKYLPVAMNTRPLAINQDIKALMPNSLALSEYLLHVLIGNGPRILATCLKSGTTVESIEFPWLKAFHVPLPPTKIEQESIAEALSDTDALIESLEQLITKKRHIKRGAMQELLTGKKRLPGFSGEWKVKRLGDVAPLQRGFDLPTTQITEGPYPVAYSNGILNYHSQFMVKGPGVVTGRSGTIGKVTYVENDYWPHNTSLWVTDFRGNDPKYIFYLYTFIKFDRFSTGSGVPTLNRNDVHLFRINIPSAPEQTAITTILTDMDAELSSLETKLTKTRQLKQGMMHNLLTGKIRLVRIASKIIPFSGKKESVNASTKSHNWQINEAVIIAVLAKYFGSEEYPLARKRCTKLTYLLHRHVERKAEGYLKKAAGPYNPATKYKGPEAIAQKNGYIRPHHNGTYPGFVAATNISQAESYFQQWYGADSLAWLEQFRRKKTDELELLATVDMAVEDLRCEGKAVKLGAVKQVIHDHPEWEAKLQREIFSDINIVRAIQICRELFA